MVPVVHGLTRRLERILQREGIRVAVLTSDVKPELREAWYERQSRQGVQVVIGHPKLCCLGLDLLEYPDLFFWETGYSLYTLRQASRRSWRIGQREEVTVKYFAYANTATGNLPAVDGQEASRLARHGGQVFHGRLAGCWRGR